jgi:ribonuclease HI
LKTHLFTDGGSRGNPGPGASAFIAVIDCLRKDCSDGRPISRRSRYVGRVTNNQAEYQAMLMAVEWAVSRGFEEIVLHSDSELLVRQLSGSYSVRASKLKPLHGRLMEMLEGKKWSAAHHRRDHRWISACDDLVNRTLDQR